jgi:hypothetical protein
MEYIKEIYKKIETKIVNTLFSLFWIYNYLFVVIEEKLTMYGLSKMYFVASNHWVEPSLETWCCITSINMTKPSLIEQYKYGVDDERVPDDALFIRKCENYRLSFITNGERVEPVPNNTQFLLIVYSHKDMKEPVKLFLDPGYIRNGNEVLDKTFVYRMLCYQYNSRDYVFDEAYEVNIMDDKIQKHTLTASQYIVFKDREYMVMNRQ